MTIEKTDTFTGLYPNEPYLTAFDFMGLGAVELTIDRVQPCPPEGIMIAGRKQNKPIIYFKGSTRGWPCPKSKLADIVILYGRGAKSPADLAGKKIKLYCNEQGKNPGAPGGKGPAIEVWRGQ
jgi:hypothetical protein